MTRKSILGPEFGWNFPEGRFQGACVIVGAMGCYQQESLGAGGRSFPEPDLLAA